MIYHYTSVENFIKIIELKELYLFNAFNMNDNLEINWINHLIDNEIYGIHDTGRYADLQQTYNSFYRLYNLDYKKEETKADMVVVEDSNSVP